VFCDGAGADGQLGNNAFADSNVAVAVNTGNVDREEIYIMLHTSDGQVDLSPVPEGGLDADFVDLTVVTNSGAGYVLSIKADAVNLVCDTNSGKVIAPQGVSVDGTALETNVWGYGVGTSQPTLWNGVTTSERMVDGLDEATDSVGVKTTVWFGINVDYGQDACAYAGKVIFSAVAGI
jgi:hypothetical protein